MDRLSACDDTIFALSSGRLPSGIAVVRVSGGRASAALTMIGGVLPVPRHASRATLRTAAGGAIDEALVLWFPGPFSATGEDVAEFHIHGGRAVLAALIGALVAIGGLRPADPGEFSRRAFSNGKLDLVAAEALDDLIHADTEQQRRQALRQLNGLLGDRARDWRQRIIDAAALVEANIDFADEADVAGEWRLPTLQAVAALRREIDDVLASRKGGERLREGLAVAIMGPPNVGKSTLMNRVAGRDVAIVSPYAGTTRDVLEVSLDLDGYPLTLIDTAGLREATDPVELEGIRRAAARAANADLVLWLDDGGLDAAKMVAPPEGMVWTVRTKADLRDSQERDLPDVFSVSAATGAGIDGLLSELARFAADAIGGENGLITRARHRVLLEGASAALARAAEPHEAELIAEELRIAGMALGRLLGRIDVDDVLDAIFSRFCIGK